jgi:eukaryotic-like serine/threonine-protein kinase
VTPDDTTEPQGTPLPPDDVGFERTRKSDPLIGITVGEYTVLERLGHGGMGILYRARHPVIGRTVAVKVLLQSVANDVTVQRMIREAQAANAVRHPNIVDIFAFGSLPDGRPYMVMELLEGRSLAEQAHLQGTLTPEQTLHVLAEVFSALEAAHTAGIVHRDLKPDNIFVDPAHEPWRVKIIDFGLARRDGPDGRLTRPGVVMGTPAFMAPEQIRGDAEVTGKADVYAMGVAAWTVLMGHEPFRGEGFMEVLQHHLNTPAPGLPLLVPEPLAALVQRMMEKDVARRPSASEVRVELARLMAPAPRPPPPSRMPLALGVGAAALVLGAAAAVLWTTSEPQPIAIVEPAPLPRPAPPPQQPEPVVAPQPVAERPAAEQAAEQTWACDGVESVTPVLNDFAHPEWWFFSISFQYGRNLVVFSDARRRRALEKTRDAVAKCKGTAKKLAATQVDPTHAPFHTDFSHAYGGDVVDAAFLRVQ